MYSFIKVSILHGQPPHPRRHLCGPRLEDLDPGALRCRRVSVHSEHRQCHVGGTRRTRRFREPRNPKESSGNRGNGEAFVVVLEQVETKLWEGFFATEKRYIVRQELGVFSKKVLGGDSERVLKS